MNIYVILRELARSIKMQNLFLASKEINGIHLFHNTSDFSKIQEIFVSYLYSYDSINKDIYLEKISKHVFDSIIYEDAYLLWKRLNLKDNKKEKKQSEVNMVVSKNIKFPVKETK